MTVTNDSETSHLLSETCPPRQLGTDKVSVERYSSPSFFEREKEAIWKKSWLLIGHQADLQKPGDYFIFDLDVVKISILVVRGKDSRIRAFLNYCKHRGAKIRYQCKGSCKALTCSFHGWVYDFEGKLIDVPLEEQFAPLPKNELRLTPINIGIWGGFIFANLDPNPSCSLEDYLKPLPVPLREYFQNEDWRWAFGYKGYFNCNWKIMVDVQSEGHHANSLHKRTITAAFEADDIPTTVYPNSIGITSRLELYVPNWSSKNSIRLNEIARIAGKFSHAAMYTKADSASLLDKYPGAVNSRNSERWVFDAYTIFPNVVMFPMRDQILLQRCWPVSPNRTLWEINHFFVGQPKNFGEYFSREQGILQEWDTVTEDMTTVGGIHDSFQSGAVDGMYLSDWEAGVRNFERRISAVVEANGYERGVQPVSTPGGGN